MNRNRPDKAGHTRKISSRAPSMDKQQTIQTGYENIHQSVCVSITNPPPSLPQDTQPSLPQPSLPQPSLPQGTLLPPSFEMPIIERHNEKPEETIAILKMINGIFKRHVDRIYDDDLMILDKDELISLIRLLTKCDDVDITASDTYDDEDVGCSCVPHHHKPTEGEVEILTIEKITCVTFTPSGLQHDIFPYRHAGIELFIRNQGFHTGFITM
jgi:hypothetical protein